MNNTEETKLQKVIFENFDKAISLKEITDFLDSSKYAKINLENFKYQNVEFLNENQNSRDVGFDVEADNLALESLEALQSSEFPGHKNQSINVRYIIQEKEHSPCLKPKDGDEIQYVYLYHKMIKTDFERAMTSDAMVFKNKEVIEKQRAVVGYLIKKVGMNILSGKSIMTVSLPINIFDVRSHLEV
jgi:hypothetical protein